MERYRQWVEEVTGGEIVGAARTMSGGSRETWFLDLSGAREPSVVLRYEGEGSFTGTELTLGREGAAYRALSSAGLRVPRVLAIHDDGTAFVMTRASGSSDLGALPAEERERVLADFVDCLADVHTTPVGQLDLPAFERPSTPAENATLDLERWNRLSDRVADLDPLLAYAGGWLVGHPPQRVAQTSFVQGDTGPGNFVASGGRVTALVDMEFSHFGDPMDDLAWLAYRCDLLAIDTAPLFARYSARSGIAVDPASLSYYDLAVWYRCAVTTSLAVSRGGGARGLAAYVLQTQRYLGGVATRLAALAGVALPPPAPAVPVTPRSDWYDRVIVALRNAARALPEGALQDETRNAQIYVQYLKAGDAIGDEAAEAMAGALAGVFPEGERGDPQRLAASAAAAGRAGDPRVLEGLLARQVQQRRPWSALLDRPRR